MGTSPITPWYGAERLETKTHVELDPGQSIEYTKHRVSPEGSSVARVSSHKETWCPYSLWTDQAKEWAWAMLVKWTQNIAI